MSFQNFMLFGFSSGNSIQFGALRLVILKSESGIRVELLPPLGISGSESDGLLQCYPLENLQCNLLLSHDRMRDFGATDPTS